MPQGKEIKTEQARIRMQKMRNKESVTADSVTEETVPASYVQGLTGKFESLPERPRFLTLSDGQVLDRLNQPEGHTSGDRILRMQACNESAYNFKPNEPDKARVKELIKNAIK